MRGAVGGWLVRAGSALVVLVVVLAISADAGTAVALVGACLIAVVGYRALTGEGRLGGRYAALGSTPRRAIRLGVILSLALAAGVLGTPGDGLLTFGILVLLADGVRAGGVLRGAVHGVALALGAGVATLAVGVVLFGTAVLSGVPGAREVLVYQLLFAPAVVAALGGIYLAAVAVGLAVLGAVCGALGGAIARLT